MRTRDPRQPVRGMIEVPRAAGGTRMLTTLEPTAAAAYARLVQAAGVYVTGHGITVGPGDLAAARRTWSLAVAASMRPTAKRLAASQFS